MILEVIRKTKELMAVAVEENRSAPWGNLCCIKIRWRSNDDS